MEFWWRDVIGPASRPCPKGPDDGSLLSPDSSHPTYNLLDTFPSTSLVRGAYEYRVKQGWT